MKIGLLTAEDAKDVNTWSGTPYHMAMALESHVGEVAYLGPLATPLLPLLKCYRRALHLAGGRIFLPFHSRILARRPGILAAERIAAVQPDVVFAPAGSAVLGHAEIDIPVIYASDATFRLMDGYYPDYSGLLASSRRSAEDLERRAIGRADLIFYPTQWAANSAIRDYGADPAKIHVLPFGANFTELPDRDTALRSRNSTTFYLLCVAVDWHRKGVPTVVEAYRELRRMNIDVELTICGSTPPTRLEIPGVTVIPSLDKNDPDQRRRLHDLYANADLFCLPTRSECAAIVFCEAGAYGLTSIAAATGGVPDVIVEGENGFLLPPEASGADYARVIAGLLGDQPRLVALRKSSRDRFERHLNWDVWGRAFGGLAEELLSRQ